MQNTYNIYRMPIENLPALKEKINNIKLIEQKTITPKDYDMTFYFSQNIDGATVWWWDTYKDLFNDSKNEPKNTLYYGLLIAKKIASPKNVYLISLGKTHFYLSNYIEKDFGIKIATRMANQETILLKKSRYFSGTKRQDISSYERFVKDSYEAGESVEHLKIKANDQHIWGDKNIIFANSVQLSVEKKPKELESIFDTMEKTLTEKEIINLPKLEIVKDKTLIKKLDTALLGAITNNDSSVRIEEIQINGIEFQFRFLEHTYTIYCKDSNGKRNKRKNIGDQLDAQTISEYIKQFSPINDVNTINVEFSIKDKGKFSRSLKTLLDYKERDGDATYFLRDGEWCLYNAAFSEYLKKSLDQIETIKSEDLIEQDYIDWRTKKEALIKSGATVKNKLVYREYYFNELQANKNGFKLLDRVLTKMKSILKDKRNYNIEVADLYKNNEIISVKISEDEKELIYNIEQSKTALELIMQKTIKFSGKIESAALWFVFEKDFKKITERNSIQLLLAVESWKKRVEFHNIKPRIYLSTHQK